MRKTSATSSHGRENEWADWPGTSAEWIFDPVALAVRAILAIALAVGVVGAVGVPAADAAAPIVFASTQDPGTPLGVVPVAPNAVTTVHLYIDGGSSVSTSGGPCCEGDGDELLGWDLTVVGRDGLTIVRTEPVGDTVFSGDATTLRFQGGDAVAGSLGPTKVFEIDVQTTTDGALDLVFGEAVGPSLEVHSLYAATLLTVPEPAGALPLAAGIALLVRLYRSRHDRRAPARGHHG